MACFGITNKVSPLNDLIEIRNGRKLAVYVSPPTSRLKGTLLFVHGVGGSAWIWHNQCEYFTKQGYQTVTFDLVGHGNSPLVVESGFCCQQKTFYASSNSFITCLQCPRNESLILECHFDAHFEDVLAIFDQFVSTSRPNDDAISDYATVLVGHSYGTSLAVRLAEARNDKVDRLVLISGGAPTPLEYEASFLNLPAACLTCFVPCIRFVFQSLAFNPKKKSVFTTIDGTDYERSSTTLRVTEKEKRMAFSFNAYTLRATLMGQVWPEGDEHFYARLRMPVLLIVGCKDKLIRTHEDEETLFYLHCGRLKLLEHAGHMSMLEEPQRVNKFIHDHIVKPPIPAVCRRYERPRLELNEVPITKQPSHIHLSDYNDIDAMKTQSAINVNQNNPSSCRCSQINRTEQVVSPTAVPTILAPRLHFKNASVKYRREK